MKSDRNGSVWNLLAESSRGPVEASRNQQGRLLGVRMTVFIFMCIVAAALVGRLRHVPQTSAPLRATLKGSPCSSATQTRPWTNTTIASS